MNTNLMVDLDVFLKNKLSQIFLCSEGDLATDDALIFSNLNLSKAEKAIAEMGTSEHKDKQETICVDQGVDDRITVDVLQKIVLEEQAEQMEWPDEGDGIEADSIWREK